MESKDIILFILTICVLYLLYCNIYCNNKKEKFTTSQSNTSITESIKNLGIIAKNLIDNNGTYIFPADVNITGRLNLLPAGTIVMWGQVDIPDGWVPCDGTRGTPDLRGRFVLGQGHAPGLSNRPLNQRSGAETHTLNESEIPPHSHTFRGISTGTKWFSVSDHRTGGLSSENTAGTWNTSNTGGGRAHNNMPPYHVLIYIMKIYD